MIDLSESGFKRGPKPYFILQGKMKDHQAMVRCKDCRGKMAFDPATHERFCSKCGLVDGKMALNHSNRSYGLGGSIHADTTIKLITIFFGKERARDFIEQQKNSGITKKRLAARQAMNAGRRRERETHRLMQLVTDLYCEYELLPQLDNHTPDDPASLKRWVKGLKDKNGKLRYNFSNKTIESAIKDAQTGSKHTPSRGATRQAAYDQMTEDIKWRLSNIGNCNARWVYRDINGRLVKRRLCFPDTTAPMDSVKFYDSLLNANARLLKIEYEKRYGTIDNELFYGRLFKKAAKSYEKIYSSQVESTKQIGHEHISVYGQTFSAGCRKKLMANMQAAGLPLNELKVERGDVCLEGFLPEKLAVWGREAVRRGKPEYGIRHIV